MLSATTKTCTRPQLTSRPRGLQLASIVTRFQTNEQSQNASTTSQTGRIDQLVKADHDKVRNLEQQYKSAPNAEAKQQLAYQAIRELSMHASKEEEVVYPEIVKVFGHKRGQHLLDEHMELKKALAKLGEMTVEKDEKAFDAQIATVWANFHQHIKEEEDREMPDLLKGDGVDAYDLGRKFEEAAEHAVTRPHTWAPDKAPINWATNRMTKPLDEAADAIRFAGKDKDVQA